MASFDAKLEKHCCASLPYMIQPQVGCKPHPNAAHLVSLVVHFLSSAASKAAPADALAADNIFVLNGEQHRCQNSWPSHIPTRN